MEQDELDELHWKLEAYGTIIRGDESTSEDQIAEASSPAIAKKLVACWNLHQRVLVFAKEVTQKMADEQFGVCGNNKVNTSNIQHIIEAAFLIERIK